MEELFTRGIDEIISADELAKALAGKTKLRIKFGVDPSAPDLHLGHAVPLHQLRKLQDMGHTIIFLIGDYTARIGDPSGKKKTRPVLSEAEIEANTKTYLDQVGRVVDIKKAEVRRNSEWLAKLSFGELLELAGNFTVAQLIERDDFRKRLDENVEVGLHELLYPVMQAYDSVALKADVEFGGSDQRFNLLAGRQLQKRLGQKPQQIWLAKLLVGTDGVNKMSKSLDNSIGLTDSPLEMYGKVMSIPDNLIAPYYELATEIPQETITELVKTLAEGANPRDTKASLAREIVRIWHNEAASLKAEEEWNQTFRDKDGPSEEQIVAYKLPIVGMTVVDLLPNLDASLTRSEVRRLVQQGGVRINDEVVGSEDVIPKAGDRVQIGKRRFFRLET